MKLGEKPLSKEANYRLKELQKKKGYTDEEMAEYLGIAEITYRRYRLCQRDLFRYSVRRLPDREYEYVCYGINLNSKWKDLSIEQKKKVNEYIDSLLLE